MPDYCDHGYRDPDRCPTCTRPPEPEQRSVYEERAESRPVRWDLIGEIDPHTGTGKLDFRRVGGWRPLSEFLRDR
jgi:hypothetical protein